MNATIQRAFNDRSRDDVFLIPEFFVRHGITHHRIVLLLLCIAPSGAGHAASRDPATLADFDSDTLQSYLVRDPEDTLVRLLLAERKLRSDPMAAAALLDLDPTSLNSSQQLHFDALSCQLELYGGANPQALDSCKPLTVDPARSLDPYALTQAIRSQALQAFVTGNIPSMLKLSHQAVTTARRTGSRRALIEALNTNAVALHKAGAVGGALEQFEQAHRLIDPHVDQDLLRTLTLDNGTAQLYAGQGEAAREIFAAALEDPAYAGPSLQLKIRSNLAEAHLRLSAPTAAIDTLEDYLANLDSAAVPVDIELRARLTLAEAELDSGDGERALQLLAATEQTLGAKLSSDQRMMLQRAVAEAKLSQGKVRDALPLLEEVTRYFQQPNARWRKLPALASLAEAYARAGRFEDAYAAQQEHTTLHASLDSAQFDQQIAAQRMQLEAANAEYAQRLRAQEAQARIAETSLARTRWASSALLLGLLMALLYLLVSRKLRARELAAKSSESEELERLVVERTNDLEKELSARLLLQDERRQLEVKIAESDKLRTMGQLTSGVAHDFNNLMTVVTLSAELIDLEADRLSSRQAQALRDIMVATNTAANITSQLLAYARQQPLHPERLNLHDFLFQSRDLFQSTLGEQLTLELNASDCCVEVDRTSLTTALLHLLTNAKEAIAGSGQVEIRVDTAPATSLSTAADQRASWAIIRVSDTGPGMSAEAREHAIEPFFTTKGEQNRSGLGLSMAFGFAQQSGGDLRIDDRAGGGTEVSLYLPLAADLEPAPALKQPAPTVSAVSGQVLLVEDKTELRNALARLIEGMGLKVATAPDASSALDYLVNEPLPDLLLSDIVMPGAMNGKELADTARARYPELRVLLMSGYSDVASGDYPMLRKPFSLEELRTEISAQLPAARAA